MDLISEFIQRYRKEYDFYEQACRMVAQALEENLRSEGIRAIVTSRAKNPARLESKIRQRALKHQYPDVSSIFDDIVDLAGVRVALYFPGESEEVGRIIESLFDNASEPKIFSGTSGKAEALYRKRFSGYSASHYRVVMRASSLAESQQRYIEARVEIQVASVLMHAWSEVEHDLIYKPLQGELSHEEHSILDELNGLVLAGEIALERLQRAGELRASRVREFENHYDLAASLIEQVRATLEEAKLTGSTMGRVDVLFDFLKALNLNKPEMLAQYVKALHDDLEIRPLSQQIIDQVLAEDPGRYLIYEQIRRPESPSSSMVMDSVQQNVASLTKFVARWVKYEQLLKTVERQVDPAAAGVRTPLKTLFALKQAYPKAAKLTMVAGRLQEFRNRLVHGINAPSPESIEVATAELEELTEKLEAIFQESSSTT